MRLLVDLGGTNTRCALQAPGEEPHLVRRFKNRRFEGLASVLQAYLDDLPQDLRLLVLQVEDWGQPGVGAPGEILW